MVLLILALAAAPAPAQRLFVSPDVPTDPGVGLDYFPWDIAELVAGAWGPGPALSVPGDPAIDAIHKRDHCGHWLFSVEAPSDLAGLLPGVEPRDVVEKDKAGTYTKYFCGGSVPDPIPIEANVDAVYQDWLGGDSVGALILSVDVPVTIAGVDVFPADLVRYERPPFPPPPFLGCTHWVFAGLEFDASASGAPWVPDSAAVNLIGASQVGTKRIIMALDIPTDLAPLGGSPPPTPAFSPHIAIWDGGSFDLFDTLTSWPVSSLVDALSCQANPGEVEQNIQPLLVDKAGGGNLDLSWGPSCSEGGEDWSIYEGFIGSYYSHKKKLCSSGGAQTATITPDPADTYYLVVSHNVKEEGSYGRFKFPASGGERPQAALPDRCVEEQVIALCFGFCP